MLMIDIDKLDWDKQSLIPAIVQDTETKQVLMLAYMNEEALKLTIETKKTWFWSRSRKELWNKGTTSGHFQEVVDIKFDCDADTILVTVNQTGVACHTGTYTCFSEEREKEENKILRNLANMIAQRDKERPEGSYTTYLLEKGLDKILKKVGEEASEVIIAAKNQSKEELIYEASDLLYHLFVLLHQQKVSLDDILDELTHRYLAKNER